MIETVLCAVDISNATPEAKVLSRAQKIAEMEGAQLDVITVIPNFGMSVVSDYFEETHSNKALEMAKKLLKELVAKTLGAEAGAKTRHIVAVGSAYREILKMADKDSADLIVLGAHQPDLKDYLLGPNAARVVRHSRCSVYVVR